MDIPKGVKNLNLAEIKTDDSHMVPISSERGKYQKADNIIVECFFEDIEDRLTSVINQYQCQNSMIIGCVAWLTNIKILKALGDCYAVQIIVQKEDFLRPDFGYQKDAFKSKLKDLYKNISLPYFRACFKWPMGAMSYGIYAGHDSIRCCGNHNRENKAASPRCHHKFLAFCRVEDGDGPLEYTVEKVWTGSFNLTHNSTNSLENAVLLSLKDKGGHSVLLQQFQREHHAIFAISEPLDWTSDWVEPEYRIGT